MNSPNKPPLRLGERLLAARHIDSDQLRIALLEQRHSQQRLGQTLINLGFIGETHLLAELAGELGCPRAALDDCTPSREALALCTADWARRHRVLPLAIDAAHTLTVAMVDIHDRNALSYLRLRLPPMARIEVQLAGESELDAAIDRHYGHTLAIDHWLQACEPGQASDYASPGPAPTVQLLDALLADAVKRQASDIHFEPEGSSLRIRYRIDGRLHAIRSLHRNSWPALCGRLKVLSGMNIAEQRLPQDGHLQQRIGGRQIDFRVATHPTLHGENLVLRILDRQKGIVPLHALGLSPRQASQLEQMLARPQGLLLVTGPTGSGKTTTLYSLLGTLDSTACHIMTLEDPVEYPLPHLRQTSLNETSKLGFAEGIRSMLRQDPDVMLIGEIRDDETAAMAVRAATTGHQVFSTLHAHSAIGAFARLADLGISSRRLSDNLIGIVAQRLVRRLCPACSTRRPYTEGESQRWQLSGERPLANGCPDCHGLGYRGRLPLVEILRITPNIDRLLADEASSASLVEEACRNGYANLQTAAREAIAQGLTTPEEAARVVDLGMESVSHAL